MRINIEEMQVMNLKDVNQCDGEFSIAEKLVLRIENDELRYTIMDAPGTNKRYGKDDIDYSTYIGDPDKVIFLAYVDGCLAGQVILRKNWNRYALIEDITVDVKYRRMGIGKKLIRRANQWAQDRGLAGIMLETQDNNVGACMFYESCGFRLRGFDKYLYRGIKSDTEEVALYWYLVFAEAQAH